MKKVMEIFKRDISRLVKSPAAIIGGRGNVHHSGAVCVV